MAEDLILSVLKEYGNLPRTRESIIPYGPRDVGKSDDALDGLLEGGPRSGKVHALRLQGHDARRAGARLVKEANTVTY